MFIEVKLSNGDDVTINTDQIALVEATGRVHYDDMGSKFQPHVGEWIRVKTSYMIGSEEELEVKMPYSEFKQLVNAK